MKRGLLTITVLTILVSVVLTGCGGGKAASSSAAIDTAKTMETTEQKVNYLVGQAKAFYNSKDFQDAVDVAQYILRYLDKDSQKAKDLLEDAKAALASQVQSAMGDAKKGLSGLGK